MQTLANPEEAIKINRLRHELSASRFLTEVQDESAQFETATNKLFNASMNKEAKQEELGKSSVEATQSVLKDLSANATSRVGKNFYQPTEERYDRMVRKDFARKPNTFAPVLMNDSYSNFRFSKRAGEVLSPLSTKKFGLNRSSMFRKMSMMTHSELMNS